MIVLVLVAVVLVICAVIYQKYANLLEKSRDFPGPPALPIIGNGLLFYNKSPEQILQKTFELVKTYGKMTKIWLGVDFNLFVTDPKAVEAILSSQKIIDKSREYDFLKRWLNDGLLVSTNKKWFDRRKAITPTFHFKILDQFVEVFEQQGNPFVAKLKELSVKDTVDVFPLATLYALDVICGEFFLSVITFF